MHFPDSIKQNLSTAALVVALFGVLFFKYGLGAAVTSIAGFVYFLAVLVTATALLTAAATRQAHVSGGEWLAFAFAAAYLIVSLLTGLGNLALLTALGGSTGLVVWFVTWLFLPGRGR